jgi:hypothetical protein
LAKAGEQSQAVIRLELMVARRDAFENQLRVSDCDLAYVSRRISLDFFCRPCLCSMGVRRDNIGEHPNN